MHMAREKRIQPPKLFQLNASFGADALKRGHVRRLTIEVLSLLAWGKLLEVTVRSEPIPKLFGLDTKAFNLLLTPGWFSKSLIRAVQS